MVVPSNDFFIGNDSPTRFRVLDSNGQLPLSGINQLASDFWDAGFEIFDPDVAASVVNYDPRTPQNGVVSFNFSELSGFNGRTTGAGYVFNSGLAANTAIYRIGFQVLNTVPEPGSPLLAALGLGAMALVSRRRRRG